MTEITRVLSQIKSGEPAAAERLLPLVYDELRKLAASKLAHERPGQTLQATALVHEAYLRLVCGERNESWDSCGHFFAAAAEAMRRILVEQARHKATIKAGGQLQRIGFEQVDPGVAGPSLDLVALDEALSKLETIDPRKAQLVKLKFFAGLTNQQAAAALDIAPSTVDLDWAYAKSWLRVELGAVPGAAD